MNLSKADLPACAKANFGDGKRTQTIYAKLPTSYVFRASNSADGVLPRWAPLAPGKFKYAELVA